MLPHRRKRRRPQQPLTGRGTTWKRATARPRRAEPSTSPGRRPSRRAWPSWRRGSAPAGSRLRRGGLPTPAVDTVAYLRAFYHGLPVRRLPCALRFVPWRGAGRASRHPPRSVGLTTAAAAAGGGTRVRARRAPDGRFAGAAEPGRLLLLDHDLYEDADADADADADDLCCGRAYGGSRVCCVSAARNAPALDPADGAQHAWPAAHCRAFVETLCAAQGVRPAKRRKRGAAAAKEKKKKGEEESPPLRRAVEAARAVGTMDSTQGRRGIWFSRVARMVAHELGHCMGLDHCVYYACNLQGAAGMAEAGRLGYIKDRYVAIAEFCKSWKHVGLFAAYEAWVAARLEELDAGTSSGK
ncbi:hypothetical protein F4780DRAFT_782913 [Xylariomycetidae sp. FL0641]|nr:hypothetical protein F4780DRAFT_782913 [Xylariomycetidae sp. FL0641]